MDTHEPISDSLRETSRAKMEPLQDERSPDEMRNQIAQRREMISQQLEQFENRIEERVFATVDKVAGNFEHLFAKMTGTVDRGVEEANHLLNDGISSVKSRLENFTQGSLQNVDIKTVFERYPIAMFGASVMAGALIGRNLSKSEHIGNTFSSTKKDANFRQSDYDREIGLNESLDDTFPASDPLSQTQASFLGRPEDNSRGAFTYQ